MIYLRNDPGSVYLTVAESPFVQKSTLRMAAPFDTPHKDGVGRPAHLRLIAVACDLMMISNAKLHGDDDERLLRVKAIISAYGLDPDDATISEVVELIRKVCFVLFLSPTSCMTAVKPLSPFCHSPLPPPW